MDLTDDAPLTPSEVQNVEEIARRGVDKAVAEDRASRRGYTVSKFGLHEDGYYHARVVIDGHPVYMHRRYGSWMCPGNIGGRAMMKEIEAMVLGTSVVGRGKEIKEALQTKVHAIEKAARLAAARKEGADADPDATADDPDAASGGEAGDDGVRDGGD